MQNKFCLLRTSNYGAIGYPCIVIGCQAHDHHFPTKAYYSLISNIELIRSFWQVLSYYLFI
jgi:hypothetical protein